MVVRKMGRRVVEKDAGEEGVGVCVCVCGRVVWLREEGGGRREEGGGRREEGGGRRGGGASP